MMSVELQKLISLASEMENYYSQRVRDICLKNLRYASDGFGYSFEHWEQTGRWIKYTDLETELKPVSKPIKQIDTIAETDIVETVKKANTRNMGVFSTETGTEKVCEFCMKRFETTRKIKRFCTDKCKIDFNNLKRRK